MPHPHALFTDPDTQVDVLTVMVEGQLLTATTESHSNFSEIIEAVHADDPDIARLFDPAVVVAEKFQALSERVTVAGGTVYFDGDPIHNSLTENILRFLNEGIEDWEVLVDYFENVAANPEPHSREQLYDWLQANESVTLTDGGFMIAYKGVSPDGQGGWRSGFSGTAVVNGETHTGHIPYAVGDVVTMPRSEVAHDPATACSRGLHVGTFDYAKGYASGALLKVLVNPRDVVSVPTDAGGAKVRVCRFEILDIVDAPVQTAVDESYYYGGDVYNDDFDEDWDDLSDF